MKNQIKLKNQKGITLVALVITVIVLLILAGVAINLTVGDNGIFKRADESAQIYQNAANNEAEELNTAAEEMEKLILGMSLDIQYTATSDSITVQVNGVNATGYIFSIKKADEENYTAMPEQTESTYTFTGLETTLYKIKIEIKTESVTLEREIEVSTEDIIKPELAIINFSEIEPNLNTAITAEVIQTDGQSGVNIGACKWVYNTIVEEIGTDENLYTGGTFNSTTENISLTATTGENYYLHVLTVDNVGNKRETVSEVIKPYIGNLTKPEREEVKRLGIEELIGEAITNTNLKDNEQIRAVITGNVPIPEGFLYETGTKETGVVIKNEADNNEFVWIPTDMVEYDRYAFSRTGWTYKQSKGELDETTGSYKIIREDQPDYYYTEAMPSDEQASVNKYKGYFIGRYEAGKESTTASGKPLFQAGMETINNITRDQAKGLAEGLYTKATNNVTSKLCSSYAWDTALKFIDTQNKGWSTNSTGANYSGTRAKTGYHKLNNIYDMGGNLLEWTTETSSRADYPYVMRRR